MKDRHNPRNFLASLIRCQYCDGPVVQTSRRESGRCYGCCRATNKACANGFLISGKCIESMVLEALRDQFLVTENLSSIYSGISVSIFNARTEESLSKNLPKFYYVAHASIQVLALLNELVDTPV